MFNPINLSKPSAIPFPLNLPQKLGFVCHLNSPSTRALLPSRISNSTSASSQPLLTKILTHQNAHRLNAINGLFAAGSLAYYLYQTHPIMMLFAIPLLVMVGVITLNPESPVSPFASSKQKSD